MGDLDISEIIKIIGAILAVLSPWLNSSFQQRALVQKAKESEVIDKRVQVIERLLALDQHLSESEKAILETELADIVQDVIAERERERTAAGADVKTLPRWNRYILLYEQPNLKASVYRGFFWFFLAIGIFGALSMALLSDETTGLESDLGFAILGASFYVVISLFFRAAAVRQQKSAQARAKEKQDARTHPQEE